MLLREFRMNDYPAVLALWQNAGTGITLRPSDETAEVSRKLERDPDLFLVAEESCDIIGVIMGAWDGRRGWLHHLAVEGAHRGRGIATALIAAVEERLSAKGCLKVNLLVDARNTRARELYARLGYAEMRGFVAMGKEL